MCVSLEENSANDHVSAKTMRTIALDHSSKIANFVFNKTGDFILATLGEQVDSLFSP